MVVYRDFSKLDVRVTARSVYSLAVSNTTDAYENTQPTDFIVAGSEICSERHQSRQAFRLGARNGTIEGQPVLGLGFGRLTFYPEELLGSCIRINGCAIENEGDGLMG